MYTDSGPDQLRKEMNFEEKLALRSETPGCETLNYFDNAGSALVANSVIDTIHQSLLEEQRVGAYFFEEGIQDRVQLLKIKLAQLIGAVGPNEIALVDSASRAWSLVLSSIPFQPGDKLVTSPFEYGANLATFEALRRRFGVEIQILPMTLDGEYDIDVVAEVFQQNIRLLALTLCPSSNGIVLDVAPICRVARESGALTLIDACQAVGQMPIDVASLSCDFLTATGRKFLRGPRGTGFLYARGEAVSKLPPIIGDHCTWHWQGNHYEPQGGASQFELWEKSVVNVLGLLEAVNALQTLTIERVEQEIQRLALMLREKLSEIDGLKIADRGIRHSGIVTFSVNKAVDWPHLKAKLREQRQVIGISNVHGAPTLMTALQDEILGRISPHVYNTEQEIDELVEMLAKVLLTSGK